MEIDAHHQPDEDKVDFPPDKISKHLGMVDIVKGLSIIQKSSINLGYIDYKTNSSI